VPTSPFPTLPPFLFSPSLLSLFFRYLPVGSSVSTFAGALPQVGDGLPRLLLTGGHLRLLTFASRRGFAAGGRWPTTLRARPR
jgi:hypothetical protein